MRTDFRPVPRPLQQSTRAELERLYAPLLEAMLVGGVPPERARRYLRVVDPHRLAWTLGREPTHEEREALAMRTMKMFEDWSDGSVEEFALRWLAELAGMLDAEALLSSSAAQGHGLRNESRMSGGVLYGSSSLFALPDPDEDACAWDALTDLARLVDSAPGAFSPRSPQPHGSAVWRSRSYGSSLVVSLTWCQDRYGLEGSRVLRLWNERLWLACGATERPAGPLWVRRTRIGGRYAETVHVRERWLRMAGLRSAVGRFEAGLAARSGGV